MKVSQHKTVRPQLKLSLLCSPPPREDFEPHIRGPAGSSSLSCWAGAPCWPGLARPSLQPEHWRNLSVRTMRPGRTGRRLESCCRGDWSADGTRPASSWGWLLTAALGGPYCHLASWETPPSRPIKRSPHQLLGLPLSICSEARRHKDASL